MKHLRKAAFLSVLLVLLLAGAAQATLQWTNNASSVLASDITAGTLSITVTTGHGDRFPEVAAPHYFMATLVDTSGNREIVKVTARTSGSNTMTITRAQEGTSARSFATGSVVELRITKNAMDLFSRSVDIHENHYVADASAADQGATTNSRSLKSLVDALGASEEATIELPHTGTGDTTTYTVGTGYTVPATVTLRVHKGARISVSAGQTLTVNGIVQAGAYQIFAGAGTATVSTYPQDQAWWGSAQRLDVTNMNVGTALNVGGASVMSSDTVDTVWIPAGAMVPLTTNGAAAGTVEKATNDIMLDYFAFDTATEEYVSFNLVMPGRWNLGTIKAKFYWAPGTDSGAVGDTVEWEIACGALSNGDTIDAALGTSQVISDAVVTGESASLHVSGATPALTVGGTPALGDMVHCKVSRNVGGTDDHGHDAWLLGALIQYTKSSTAEAAW